MKRLALALVLGALLVGAVVVLWQYLVLALVGVASWRILLRRTPALGRRSRTVSTWKAVALTEAVTLLGLGGFEWARRRQAIRSRHLTARKHWLKQPEQTPF